MIEDLLKRARNLRKGFLKGLSKIDETIKNLEQKESAVFIFPKGDYRVNRGLGESHEIQKWRNEI